MQQLAENYVTLHRQGFVPIFVADRFDAVLLAEAAVAAGAEVIEITCRRRSVCDDIERIKKAFSELIILVGSTVDDGPMLDFLQWRRPDMPSIDRLCDLGVEGIVSAMPLSLDTVARLSQTHLVIPGVESITEAVQAVNAGRILPSSSAPDRWANTAVSPRPAASHCMGYFRSSSPEMLLTRRSSSMCNRESVCLVAAGICFWQTVTRCCKRRPMYLR